MGHRKRHDDGATAPSGPHSASGTPEELLCAGFHVRVIQPYRAVKLYRCPGCDHEVALATLHVVVWPDEEPEERRHWHRGCWMRHLRREGTRRGPGNRPGS